MRYAESYYDCIDHEAERYAGLDARTEDALEQMMAEPDMLDCFLSHRTCPPSVASLLSLLLDRGLPRMDKSERDDELRDRLDAALDAVQLDFREWAETPVRHGVTPVGAWVDDDRV